MSLATGVGHIDWRALRIGEVHAFAELTSDQFGFRPTGEVCGYGIDEIDAPFRTDDHHAIRHGPQRAVTELPLLLEFRYLAPQFVQGLSGLLNVALARRLMCVINVDHNVAM